MFVILFFILLIFKLILTWYVTGSICNCMCTAKLLFIQYNMAGTENGNINMNDGISKPFSRASGINIPIDNIN